MQRIVSACIGWFFLCAGTAGATPTIGQPLSGVFQRLDVRDAGVLPSTQVVALKFVLQPQHEAELRQLVANQNQPGSPLYRRYLTPAQFDAYYAPSPTQANRIAARLRAAGFRVTAVGPGRDYVEAAAPVFVVNRYLSTDLHRIVQSGWRRLAYANRTKETLPPELGGDVLTVLGLNNAALAHPTIALPTNPIRNSGVLALKRGAPGPSVIGGPATGPGGLGFGPSAIASAYDLPANHGFTGGGGGREVRPIGFVGAGAYLDSDLQRYQSYFQVNRTGDVRRLLTSGGGTFNPNDGNWSLEETLDVETIASLAPGASVRAKSAPAPLTDGDWYNEAVELTKIDLVHVLSMSVAQCEGSDVNFESSLDSLAIQANSLGISYVASSGDNGYNGCPPGQYVEFPASDPNVTALGGTSPAGGTAYTSETAWSGSGSGSSPRFGKPYWQRGDVPGSHRDIADIAAAADPNSGNPLAFNGSFPYLVGGTSWSAPIFASALVEIDDMQNRLHGNATPAIYNNYYTYGYGSGPKFHDVTSGVCGYNYGLPIGAGGGWDYCTGIGSVDAYNLGSSL